MRLLETPMRAALALELVCIVGVVISVVTLAWVVWYLRPREDRR